jgi:hypothetical protein
MAAPRERGTSLEILRVQEGDDMMRHYSRYGQFVGAMILSLGLAAPVMAQAVPRQGDWDRGGWYGGGNSDAYRNGYNAGSREGERDARDRKDYGFKRDDVYEDADWGYRGGSKGDYKRRFRDGYEAGYDQGYRRYAGNGGGWGRPGDGGYYPGDRPGGGYGGGYGDSGQFAYRNGYSDGYEEGRSAGQRNRSFNPTGEGRYRSATRGYDSRYGSRGAYQQDYRSGFRSGYEEGYRDGRRDRRW